MAEERNIRMEDSEGNSYYPHGKAKTVWMANGKNVEDVVNEHSADYLKHTGYAVATGSANAYLATLIPALSAYAEGVSLRLKINAANTGASTVNVNGLGAKSIKKSNGNAVSAGNLKAGVIYTLAFDGTSFILQGEGGSGNAQPEDVRTGKTFSNDTGEQVGAAEVVDITPSNTLVHDNAVEKIHNISTINAMVKIKESSMPYKGRVRVKYDLRSPHTDPIKARIYVNDSPVGVGTTHSSTTYVTYTEDIEVPANARISIYVSGSSYSQILVKNLQLLYGSLKTPQTII